MRNEIGMLCLHEKSRNGEIGTLILCQNSVITQSLHCSLLWCLWAMAAAQGVVSLTSVGCALWAFMLPAGYKDVLSCFVPGSWFVTVTVVGMHFWFIFLSLPFHRYISLLLPAFSDDFASLYFKVTLLIPSHHYKRCHKSEVMDLYYLLCFQILVFKLVNLIFCLPSSPCDHEIAI